MHGECGSSVHSLEGKRGCSFTIIYIPIYTWIGPLMCPHDSHRLGGSSILISIITLGSDRVTHTHIQFQLKHFNLQHVYRCFQYIYIYICVRIHLPMRACDFNMSLQQIHLHNATGRIMVPPCRQGRLTEKHLLQQVDFSKGQTTLELCHWAENCVVNNPWWVSGWLTVVNSG